MKLEKSSRIFVTSFLALAVALVAACSDTASAPDTSSSGAVSPPEDASSTGDGDGGAEASVPPRPREIVSTSGDQTVGASCDSVCATRGGAFAFKCAACQPGKTAVGESSYRSYATNPAGKKDTVIEACAAAVPKKLTEGATSYDLWSYSCCCEGPKLEEVAGAKVTSPTSCGEVCRGKGLSCDPQNVWGDVGDGPFELTYVCGAGYDLTTTTSGNDNGNTVVYGCDSVPTATFTRTEGLGGICKLASYTCACR